MSGNRTRGERRWIYTVGDVADASGQTVAQVKYARKLGILDLDSLDSVSAWIAANRLTDGFKEMSDA